MTSVEAQTAARWWAEQIRNGTKLDNGEPMHGVLGALLQSAQPTIDPELIDAYEAALAVSIERNHRNRDGEWFRSGFGVDYHPDQILSAPLESVGIRESMTTLPWKTVMWISDGSVRVSHGYRADIVELPLIGGVS